MLWLLFMSRAAPLSACPPDDALPLPETGFTVPTETLLPELLLPFPGFTAPLPIKVNMVPVRITHKTPKPDTSIRFCVLALNLPI
jgi:hypothetical protein